MAATETTQAAAPETAAAGRRNEKVGNVVSTKMQKTIVVEVEMQIGRASCRERVSPRV